LSDPLPKRSDLTHDESLGLLRVLMPTLAACLLFLLVIPTDEQPLHPSSDEVRRQVVGVVKGQFNAFRDRDYELAYSFAATGVQQQFTVTAFERMVKGTYPAIAFWRTVSFGEVEDNGQRAVVQVSVQGRSRRTRFFRYGLVREANKWRIGSVMEISRPPAVQGQPV